MKSALRNVVLAALSTAIAFGGSPWRYWTEADGMVQSIATGVGIDPQGRILVGHISVPEATLFDGFGSRTVPDVHTWGRLSGSERGNLWTITSHGIEGYDGHSWSAIPIRELSDFFASHSPPQNRFFHSELQNYPLKNRPDLVAVDDRFVLVLLPDRLLSVNLMTRGTTVILSAAQAGVGPFRSAEEGWDHTIWVSGERGLLALNKDLERPEWKRFKPPAGMSDLVVTAGSHAGEALVTAAHADSRRSALIFANGRWTELHQGGPRLWAVWFGEDGTIWMQDGDHILRYDRGQIDTIEPADALSGTLYDVSAHPDGTFWVASGQGVSRHAPMLWSRPDHGLSAGDVVVSIQEDRDGRIWFLSKENLIVNDHGAWSKRTLPAGYVVGGSDGTALQALPSGELAIASSSAETLLILKPNERVFRVINAPAGRIVGRITLRREGGLWVQTMERDRHHWSLDAWQNGNFLPGAPQRFPIDDVLNITEARDGSIWIGAAVGLWRLRGQEIHRFMADEGVSDVGYLSIAEARDGTILAGGRNTISRWDGRAFHTVHQARNSAAFSISFDREGRLWAATSSGITRRQAGQWIANTSDDGLPATGSRRVFEDSRGSMWAGTVGGIALFNPSADQDPPRTWIAEDRNMRETPTSGEVRLTFDGADKWKFTAPDRLLFSWRLDGGPWGEFQPNRFASYKALRVGQHTFEVRAMDRSGNIDPKPAVWKLSVPAPWYLQPAFLVVAALAAAMLALLLALSIRALRQVVFASRHDTLTGLANRAFFDSRLELVLAGASRSPGEFALLMLDLDRFKPINDTLGHAVGDHFLIEVARRLNGCVRPGDAVARVGGDEFAVLLPHIASRTVVERIASDIVAALARTYHIDSFEVTSSASLGIAIYPEHGLSARDLKRASDAAMYRCKAEGRGQFQVFDPAVVQQRFRSIEMASLIQEALDHGYYELHYQPVTRQDGTTVSYEALVRMRHPAFGLIGPDDFIPVAEQTGSMIPLGAWVMREACRQMSEWRAQGRPALCVNVNVSASQIVLPDFAAGVIATLKETGLNPSALIVEITESTLMRNWAMAGSQAEALRAVGVRIALDDFGSGYSSLSALHQLPVDCLKIDKAFTRRMTEGRGGMEMIAGIIGLAHSMGFEVVAEGVELNDQRDRLYAVNCDCIQGFLISRPMPAGQVSLPPGLSAELSAEPAPEEAPGPAELVV